MSLNFEKMQYLFFLSLEKMLVFLYKYLEIFEMVLPLIFTSSDPSLYIATINLYNKWKLSKLEVENRKEAQEIKK